MDGMFIHTYSHCHIHEQLHVLRKLASTARIEGMSGGGGRKGAHTLQQQKRRGKGKGGRSGPVVRAGAASTDAVLVSREDTYAVLSSIMVDTE